MTKQEEIRGKVMEFVAFLLDEVPPEEFRTECILSATREVLTYLHSQGVVLKVEGELSTSEITYEEPSFYAGYDDAKQDMLRAGYVKTEPLIKEE